MISRLFGMTAWLPLGVLLAAPAPLTSASDTQEAVLAVADTRHHYIDGIETADFESPGCPAASDYVVVETCDGTSRGLVRFALLGFDAAHSADVGVLDVPGVMVDGRTGLVQTSQVSVELRRAGDLVVQVVGDAADDLDPRPVEGTAVPSASMGEREVTWTVTEAEPGTYDFQVSFEVDEADADLARTFLPQVRVFLHSPGGHAASQFDGRTLFPSATRSSLVMHQHVSRQPGEPSGRARAFDHQSYPPVWAGQARIDADGPYDPASRGEFRHAIDVTGAPMPPSHSVALTASWATGKVNAVGDIHHGEDTPGWTFGLRTTDDGKPLQDKDSLQAAFVGSVGYSRAEEDREPIDDSGRLTTLGDERWAASSMSAISHADAYQEPTVTHGLLVGTRLQLGATNGDIDNRDGDEPVMGEPIRFAGPAGYVPHVLFVTLHRASPIAVDFEVRFTDDGFVVTPSVEPDSYVLEATTLEDGWHDWTASMRISATFIPEGFLADVINDHLVDVGVGETIVRRLSPDGSGTTRTITAPGTYRIGPTQHPERTAQDSQRRSE